MAANVAQLGTLAVRLAIDAKQMVETKAKVDKDLKDMDGSFKKVAASAKNFAMALAAAATAAGTALAFAVKRSIEFSAQMDQLAERTGIAIESLSGLQYAADQSGVKLETLTSSVNTLQRSLGEIAGGGMNQASRALDAMGISATNANGTLKDTDQLIAEVADKFSQYEDGANKSALAVRLFGEAGAAMIPMLNQGSQGLREAREEARLLGLELDSKTAKAANNFSTNIGKLWSALGGIFNMVSKNLMPWLEKMSTKLLDLVKNTDAMKIASDAVTVAVKVFATVIVNTTHTIIALTHAVKAAAQSLRALWDLVANWDWSAFQAGIASAASEIAKIPGVFKSNLEILDELWNGVKDGATETGEVVAQGLAPVVESLDAVNERAAHHNDLLARGMALWHEVQTPMEQYQDALAEIARLHAANAIGAEVAGRAQVMAAATAATAYLQVANQIGGAISSIFGKSKAAAVASAIVNTAQGITRTIAQYGMTPIGIAAAAAAAASGAAQIAAINSTNEKGGGSSAAAVSSPGPEALASAPQSRSLHIQGLDPHSIISGSMMAQIIEEINDAVANGATLISTSTRARATA